MRHIIFQEATSYSIALLAKATAFKEQELLSNYVEPLVSRGLSKDSLIAFTLDYNDVGKAPAAFIKEYLDKLLPALDSLGVQYLYVTDAAYFKVLTKEAKAEPHYGYVLSCKIKGYEHMSVVLGLNYQALIYNPDLQAKLDMSLDKLASTVGGCTHVLGSDIIHSASYPDTTESIAAALEALHQYPRLTADIETRSLRFQEAGIETIAFGIDKHKGVAFCVDKQNPESKSRVIKQMLKTFFSQYKGKLIYHNASFDIQILIYELWMKPL